MKSHSIPNDINILAKVILAAIDYEFERFKPLVREDQLALLLRSTNSEKDWVNKFKSTNDVKELKKMYKIVIKLPTLSGDKNFIEYVKKKSGIEIDLFGNIEERVQAIIKRGHISTKKEREDFISLSSINKNGNFDLELYDKLMSLTSEYDYQTRPKSIRRFSIHRGLNDIFHDYSPDKKALLMISKDKFGFGKDFLSVWIHYLNGSHTVFRSYIEDQSVIASWKNSNLVEIEYLKEDIGMFKKEALKLDKVGTEIKISFSQRKE